MCGSFLRQLTVELSRHCTPVGRLLLPLLLGFRVLLLATVGLSVYSHDQREFTCNTLQWGCKVACYDAAHPLSPLHFWASQILLVAVPSAIYLGFAFYHVLWHWDASGKLKEEETPREGGGSSDHQGTGARQLFWAYVVQLGVRLALEGAALGGQYQLYGSKVPALFLCRREPCPGSVMCVLSRPSEKSILLKTMLGLNGLCFLFTLLELVLLGLRRWWPALKRRRPFSKCCLTLGAARGHKEQSGNLPEVVTKGQLQEVGEGPISSSP
ncbi:gap junction gamma-3 protein [Sorex fumeus]|uniref:gap junction gamma-3 protein n=1 Tax=Sorex fumeus TaxID=62283 RepID=UPI0024ACFE57|nr:gap junction gamma-3 protein [Sorex fumeus]